MTERAAGCFQAWTPANPTGELLAQAFFSAASSSWTLEVVMTASSHQPYEAGASSTASSPQRPSNTEATWKWIARATG